jgi:hypothetical protein
MNAMHAEGDCHVDIFFYIVDKKYLFGFDRCPLHGRLKDFDSRFLKSHLVGQNPFIKDLDDGEFGEDIVKMKRIGVGKKAEPPSFFQGEDDPGDPPVFYKDVAPKRDKFVKGDRKIKGCLNRLKKIRRGYFPYIQVIDGPFLRIEEKRKYLLWILKIFIPSKSEKFFCNLIMVKRKDDIAKIEEDDLHGHLANPNPSRPPLPTSRQALVKGGEK